jgi:hypothetical protein
VNTGALCRPPTALPGNQFEPAIRHRSNNNGLKEALRPERTGELVEAGVIERMAGLSRIRPNLADLEP